MKMFRYIRSCCILRNSYHKTFADKLSDYTALSRSMSECLENTIDVHETQNSRSDRIPGIMYKSRTAEYWRKEITTPVEEINWDELFKNFQNIQETMINAHAIIAVLCHKNNLYDTGISFFKYLYNKRELTPGMLYLFCSLMEEQMENYKECEEIIYNIFLNVSHTDALSARTCSKILLQSPRYWKSILPLFTESVNDCQSYGVAVLSLLETNKVTEAIELYIQSNARQYTVDMAIIKKLLQMSENDDLPVSLTEKFLRSTLNAFQDSTITDEYFDILKCLFQKLEEIDDEYMWNVEKGCLTECTCSVCKGKLKAAHTTAEEVDVMCKDMEESVIFKDNIYIKSNEEEWPRFQKIVQQSNYNIVLDGLNILRCLKGLSKLKYMLNYIEKIGLTPFTLARKHIDGTAEHKILKEKGPVFLTDNLSDDDVFVLYAALRKGKGCYVVSNDKMRFCNSELSTPAIKDIYKNWQVTHQFGVNFHGHLYHPQSVTSGSHQCKNCEEDEFKYHIVNNNSSYPVNLVCISKMRRNHELTNGYDIKESSDDNEKQEERHWREISSF